MDELLNDLITNLEEVKTACQGIMEVSPVASNYIQIAAEARNIHNICGYWQSMARSAMPPADLGPIPMPMPSGGQTGDE